MGARKAVTREERGVPTIVSILEYNVKERLFYLAQGYPKRIRISPGSNKWNPRTISGLLIIC